MISFLIFGRYFAIICPFKNLVPFERHTKWIIALIWIFGMTIASPHVFISRAMPFNLTGAQILDCRETWEGQMGSKVYTTVVFLFTFLIPFIALTYLYVSIAIKAFRHVIPGNADASRDQAQLRNKIRVRRAYHPLHCCNLTPLFNLNTWYPSLQFRW